MRGRSWKGASAEDLARIRDMLQRRGGIPDRDLRNPFEAWRVRVDRAVFTGYTTGTVYCNGAEIPELPFLYRSISEILGRA